ncbi:thermonuclease family protein [Pyrococcus abyssi]|uniref:Thermonuclease n=1 Tax=Pyrococcus abyssi (strain GE5 / Orsay) TaxID=272844 RepID=Q9UZT7_PYRAB|nr:thermonuclease family protein [Pyrococcus abyssi]CAB49969.1 Thermonuclease precursor [Pyrococcus abyssi GE5]CCE70469.1 TPA: thermonuclease precursor [Pyrococcus abyssi GE5]
MARLFGRAGRFVSSIILIALILGCLSQPKELHGKVVKVVDGDTVYVKLSNGETVKVRLIGIDAPELEEDLMRPGEYPGIHNLSCLVKYGYIAKEFLKNYTLGKDVTLIFDSIQGRKDKYGRLLAYLYINGTDVNAELVKMGLARVFYEKKFDKIKEYSELEDEARKRRQNLWSCN